MKSALPSLHFDHVIRLTDHTGICQHATYGIPNYQEGYCLDDNARALLLMLTAYRYDRSETALRTIPIYLAYVHYAQNADGTFRNFMGFNRNFLDERGTDDAFGRAIWALGYTAVYAPYHAYRQLADELIKRSMPRFQEIRSIRSIAMIILGLCHYVEINSEMQHAIRQLASRLQSEYYSHRSTDWHWYESLLAYDNALLPLAMRCAARVTNLAIHWKVTIESHAFLERHTVQRNYISLIGNEGWFPKGNSPATFAQQPLDAMAMVLLYREVYEDTGQMHFKNIMLQSFRWFLGENVLGIPLYDEETKGCQDGLQRDGVNQNQGAESTLAFWIAYLAVQSTMHIKVKT